MSGHRPFSELRDDLERRLDALPNGEGDRIRKRNQAELEAELAGFTAESTLRNLEAISETLAAAHDRRDELILDAAELGVTHRVIAAAAGLSENRVGEIIKDERA